MPTSHPSPEPQASRPARDPLLLWRRPDVLQQGLDPDRCRAVAGVGVEVATLARRLAMLGPALEDREHERAIWMEAARRGLDESLAGLMALLDLEPRPPVAPTWVHVLGAGALALGVASVLRRTAGLEVEASPGPPPAGPDLLVLAPAHGRGLVWAEEAMLRGSAHVFVHLRDGRVVLGPLVRPGHSPCLRCLDLTRAGWDDRWPALALQWEQSADSAHARRAGDVPAARALAAGLLGRMVALGSTRPGWEGWTGRTLEEQPDATVRNLRWRGHPDCGCGAP